MKKKSKQSLKISVLGLVFALSAGSMAVSAGNRLDIQSGMVRINSVDKVQHTIKGPTNKDEKSIWSSLKNGNITSTDKNGKGSNAYKLVLEDNFDVDSLNTNDWNFEDRDTAWVNGGLQEYGNSAENTYVQDDNYIHNGQFDEGNEPGRFCMQYWNWGTDKCDGVSVSVTPDKMRELKVTVPDGVVALEDVIVNQSDLALPKGKKLVLSFDAYADKAKNIKSVIGNYVFDSVLTTERQNFKYEITMSENADSSSLSFLLGTPGTVYIDNVCIRENNMIVNGNFSGGMTGYEVYVNETASVMGYAVNSLNENDAFFIDIADTGKDTWNIQLKQSGIRLEKGKWYRLSFDAMSTMNRDIMYMLQKNGAIDNNWTAYSGQPKASLTKDYKNYSIIFKMDKNTDANAIFSIYMGAVGGKQIDKKHIIVIDNITLLETTKPATATNTSASSNSSSRDSSNNNAGENNSNNNAGENNSNNNAYRLVWEDDFDGDKLNLADWNIEEHDPGWVNAEVQEYVNPEKGKAAGDDSDKNLYVKDGMLYIQALERLDDDGNPIFQNLGGADRKTYTSARINTQGKHDFQYGRFETRAKVPSGTGFLPAFWMMPTDEGYYGQWPKCGEIDIMEVHGSALNTSYGTLHFGDPHTQKQGSHTLSSGPNFGEDFHVFACEWEPGEIRFYVDDELFYTVNDWFTQTPGYDKKAYPAPYDQNFYLILNLAVGGSWVGYPDNNIDISKRPFVIDYVRVYQKDSYDMDVDKPVNDVVLRDPDSTGNYINNGDFSKAGVVDDKSETWQLLLANGGAATAEIKDGAMHITSTSAGSVNYGVQVVQPGIPLEKGMKYRLTYYAYADAARTMITGISAPDKGYIRYLEDSTVNLTSPSRRAADAYTQFTHEFTMTNDSDANARLEFNLGNQGSTATVHIKDVRLEKVGAAEEEKKGMLPNGSYLYNGTFDVGDEPGKRRLAYWDWDTSKCSGASVSVTADSRRELKVTVPDGVAALDNVVVSQGGMAIPNGEKLVISFDAYADRAKTIKGAIGSYAFESALTTERKQFKYQFDADGGNVLRFLLGTPGTVYIDNVSIRKDGMIVNGDFSGGMVGYEVYVNDAAKVSGYIVDSLNENGAFSIDIDDTGAEEWYIQLKQNGIKLEKDKWYKLSFDAKSTVGRKITYALQRDGSKHKNPDGSEDWTAYCKETADLEQGYKTFEVAFKMNKDTDPETILSISMGAVGAQISNKHTIVINNINLVETEAQSEPAGPSAGENMIKNGDFAKGEEGWVKEVISPASTNSVSFENGKAVYDISSVGNADWNIKLRYNDKLTLEKGASYNVKMKITSTAARTVKYSLMDSSYAWYAGQDLPLAANTEYAVDFDFTVDKDTSSDITFAISMGKIDSANTPASKIEIDDIIITKTSGGQTPSDTPAELIKNGDFANGGTNWSSYVHTGDGASATEPAFTDSKARYEIQNVGSDNWHIQLKQEGLALETGATYKVNLKVASSATRKIQIALQNSDGSKWYGGADIDLTANKLKSVSRIITLDSSKPVSDNDVFQISMGKIIGDSNLDPHTIEIYEVSIIKVKSDATADTETETDIAIASLISEEELDETEVLDESSDEKSTDEETSDVESADEETSDVESTDEETSDVESADEETSDVESTDEETSDVESTDEEVSDEGNPDDDNTPKEPAQDALVPDENEPESSETSENGEPEKN